MTNGGSSISSRDGFRPAGGQSSPVETGENQPIATVLGRAAIGCLSRSSTSIPFTHIPPGRFQTGDRKSIQRSRARFHTGSSSNTLGRRSDFLRIAYYLGTVLSAVLTTGSLCGERVTLPAETCSVPLRSGSSSPTFLTRLSWWEYHPRGYFVYFRTFRTKCT